ncbi:helix-turn-helix transcriptional regulator [Adlercreutzia equolifaciens]|uniref:helix-turn-helix transcriptional regulator n=1 Tax=Adlercreutzia equolifaciens TaxID=446660 RepID=UPI0023B19CB2|nr:helix-turn-helix transcriptional regulator [Adlercreutzia equolifaciens]MDE8703455.1 helix-turn-helix transcriptional regulator [Adlercreutzia equolifaciens]
MQISKYFRPEALLLTAFLATLPIYAPNQLLFNTEFTGSPLFMAPFANTLLGGTVLCGIFAAVLSVRRGDRLILSRGAVSAASVAYLAGYALLIVCAAVEGWATPVAGVVAGSLLAFATVVLAVAWGVYMAQFSLRWALLWVAVMVGAAALMELLLSAVTFAVGALVFCLLLPLACALPCWLAWRANTKGSGAPDASGGESDGILFPMRPTWATDASSRTVDGSAPKPLRVRLGAMASMVAMPFVGLMVFAFMMGTRKFVLFDVVHMEVLGCALGAVAVVPLCLFGSKRPLMPLIYRLLLPLACLVLIVLNAFPGGTPPLWLAGWMTYPFYGAVAILALAGLCAVAHAGEFPPGLVYGVALAGFAACSLLGVAATGWEPFKAEGGGPALLVVSTLYFAYMLASALISPWRRHDVEDEDATETDGAPARTPDVAARCEVLADECGLTPREREIFGYLGRGHGIAFVADTLVISESTVRTHVKSIYKKLGVGSREELLEKVDA